MFPGGYIFNTEAHPIDPSALECCTGASEHDILDHLRSTLNGGDFHAEFKGDTISARLEEIETRRQEEARKRKAKELELQRLLNERHLKEREILRKKKELEEIRRQKKALEESEDLLPTNSDGGDNFTTGEDVLQTSGNTASNENAAQLDSIFVGDGSSLEQFSDDVITTEATTTESSIHESEYGVQSGPDASHSDSGPIENPFFSGASHTPERVENELEPPVMVK